MTPDHEITLDEWIAAGQACCGIDPDDEPATAASGGREPAEGEGRATHPPTTGSEPRRGDTP